LPSHLRVPEIEPQRPNALGRNGLGDSPDEGIPQIVRPTMGDHQARLRTLRTMDNAAEF